MKDKLRFIVLLLCTQFFIGSSLAQNPSKQFYFSAFGSLQKVDDRLIGTSDSVKKNLQNQNEKNPNNLTKHIGFEIGALVYQHKKIFVNIGLSYSFERNNFYRVLNKDVLVKPGDPFFDVMRYMDTYNYYMFGVVASIGDMVIITKHSAINIGIHIAPNIKYKSYYKEALVSSNENIYNKWDFFSIEFNPFVGLRYRDVELDFYYRIFQIKKVDRAIFYKYNTGYGAIENDFETYNPTKFGVSVKYLFNLFKMKSNEKRMSE